MWPHLIIGLGFGGAVFRVLVVVGFGHFLAGCGVVVACVWACLVLWWVLVVTLSLFYGQQFIADCPAHKWA